jgi:hypothetical protein
VRPLDQTFERAKLFRNLVKGNKVSIISTIFYAFLFLYESAFCSFSQLRIWLWTNFCMKKSCWKMLMKLTQGVNFNNSLLVPFVSKIVFQSFSLITVWLCNFFWKNIGEKAAHEMLINVTKAIMVSISPTFFWVASEQIFFCQKITKQNCDYRNAEKNIFFQKCL